MRRFFLVFFYLGFHIFNNCVFASTEIKKVNVIKEDKPACTLDLFLIDGMGYVSTDDIANIYNAKINWYPTSKKVILTLNSKEVIFKIGSQKVIIDNTERLMKKPARLEKGKLLIPLEFLLTKGFSQISGFFNEWDYRRLSFRIIVMPDIFPPRHYSYRDKTRIVIQAAEKKEMQLDFSKEKNILIKTYKSKIDAEKSSITINDGVVNNITATNLERDVLFNIELGTYSGKCETFTLSSPFRLIVDIERTVETESVLPGYVLGLAPSVTGFSEASAAPEVISSQEEKEKIVPAVSSPVLSHKAKKIVIDAGHGGEDPGAIGPRDTKEKDINLSVAKRLAEVLKENGYEVYMTREDDTFIPLSDRTKFANKVMADLFISIHCNASISNNTSGFEIYFLSEKASDSAAEAVANMENSVIAMEKHNAVVKGDIGKLLRSMAVNEFMNESSSLCGVINKEVCTNFENLCSLGIKQANFYVLRGATMPAILVEIAFLSNVKEEKLLNQKKFQKKMVQSIFNGIELYEKQTTK
ncbi:MAG: N-acetylmuramoyl-L-alanine amidase [Elusimicrobia bacterium]|nr:N-acetylmuramoyl-L-alanine amidase [Elusimicrobiota bacterium]